MLIHRKLLPIRRKITINSHAECSFCQLFKSTVGWCWGASADRPFPLSGLTLASGLDCPCWLPSGWDRAYGEQAIPLRRNAVAALVEPVNVAAYPKPTDCPGAMVAFQPASRIVTCRPD